MQMGKLEAMSSRPDHGCRRAATVREQAMVTVTKYIISKVGNNM